MGPFTVRLDPIGANVWHRSRVAAPAGSSRMIDRLRVPHDSDIHPTDNPCRLTPSKRLSAVAPQIKVTLDALLVDRLELTEADASVSDGIGTGADVFSDDALDELADAAAEIRSRFEIRYAELCDQIAAAIQPAI